MRPGEVPVLEILTQSSVNETAMELITYWGRKEQKVLPSRSVKGEEGIAESTRASHFCSALLSATTWILSCKGRYSNPQNKLYQAELNEGQQKDCGTEGDCSVLSSEVAV